MEGHFPAEGVLEEIHCVDPYIDDVIIGSTGDTEEEAIANHLVDLRRVLDRLKEVRLLVNPRKAQLFMREVEFCGHILKEGRRQPAPGKLLSIQMGVAHNSDSFAGIFGAHELL